MSLLLSLWLPILLSALAVWILSTILSLPFFHHKHDWVGLPGAQEDALMDAIRNIAIAPGNYLFPDFRTRAQMESAKVKQAHASGPVGHLSLWRTPMTMGATLTGTLLVYLIVSTLIAYLASVALPMPPAKSPDFAKVFQRVGTAGVLAYSFAFIPSDLWFGASKRAIAARIFDGVVCGLITGAIFAWRWPH